MRKLVKEIFIVDEEKSLKEVKRYLSRVKLKYNERYLDEIRKNQNVFRKFVPVITIDAQNLLNTDPIGIAMKKLQENSVAMIEIRYNDNVSGKLLTRKSGNRIKLYLEYTNEAKPLLTIF
jgi:hypothetical protein